MARYYASIQGNRGEATRTGTANSGISGHVRGWYLGASVECHADNSTGVDVVEIEITGGSHSLIGRRLATVYAPLDSGLDVVVLADTPEIVAAARELIRRHEAREAS